MSAIAVRESVRRSPEVCELNHVINGLQTYSCVVGTGAPVVLVHGAGVSSTYWRPAQAALARAGYRVYALDLPGFGRSENPSWSPRVSRLSEHLCRWLEQVVPEPLVLIGQSFGCDMALRAAVQKPEQVERLVLAAPNGLPRVKSVSLELARAAVDAFREPLRLFPAILPDYFRYGPVRLFQLLAEQRTHQSEQLLSQVTQPTLVLRGREDVVVTPDCVSRVAGLVPHAVTATMPGAHGAHFSEPEAFAEVVTGWLRRAG